MEMSPSLFSFGTFQPASGMKKALGELGIRLQKRGAVWVGWLPGSQ